MAKQPTFEQLKTEVAMRAEESGVLPPTVTVGGAQYTLVIPTDMKVQAMQVMRNPAKLDALLNHATFTASDGTRIGA